MNTSTWRVTLYYSNRTQDYLVQGWKPLLHLIRYARATPGIHRVDVGNKIGPALVCMGIAGANGETDHRDDSVEECENFTQPEHARRRAEGLRLLK